VELFVWLIFWWFVHVLIHCNGIDLHLNEIFTYLFFSQNLCDNDRLYLVLLYDLVWHYKRQYYVVKIMFLDLNTLFLLFCCIVFLCCINVIILKWLIFVINICSTIHFYLIFSIDENHVYFIEVINNVIYLY
jgi:hypothetical protein